MNSLIIAENIIKRAFKNRREIIIMLVLPIAAIMIITCFTGSSSTQPIKAGVVNLDGGVYADKLISDLSRQKNLQIDNINEKDIKAAVSDSRDEAVLVINKGFSKSIGNGEKPKIDFYSSGQNETSEKIKQQVNGNIQKFLMISCSAKDIASKTGKSTEAIQDKLFSNINNSSLSIENSLDGNRQEKLVQSVGFSMMFIMVIIFNTMGTIAEDKKKLVLARTATFKVKLWEIALGNLLGTLLIGVIQIMAITLATAYIYKLPIGIKIYGLFFILLCFIISVIGLAIGLSGIIKNNLNPSILLAIVSFPTCLLGGCLIPESLMPSVLRNAGYIVPQKWVMGGIQDLMTGASADKILLKCVIVLMFGLAFTTFGVKTIKPLDE